MKISATYYDGRISISFTDGPYRFSLGVDDGEDLDSILRKMQAICTQMANLKDRREYAG